AVLISTGKKPRFALVFAPHGEFGGGLNVQSAPKKFTEPPPVAGTRPAATNEQAGMTGVPPTWESNRTFQFPDPRCSASATSPAACVMFAAPGKIMLTGFSISVAAAVKLTIFTVPGGAVDPKLWT